MTTPHEPLNDDDIKTTSSDPVSGPVTDADGTDGDATDTTDGDSSGSVDADSTDSTDSTDADATDA
ncbi:MAG: hypothetical protein H0U51_07930 [Propionibacteriales bacterium]|nr:hypothetical protein [Propionibacteriales bacterium]